MEGNHLTENAKRGIIPENRRKRFPVYERRIYVKNRFGLFIHWGLYAIPAFHEQVMAKLDYSHEEYESLMTEFDPRHFDPEKWVLDAKAAGMEYLCFTAKHHDGFCMWDTKYTDYKVTNTPCGRDVLGELSRACEKHGMLLSVYYSNPDWHHENAYNPLSSHQWKAKREHPDMDAYIAYIKGQITELLTNYGKIYTLFWDIPPQIADPSVNALARSLQPEILINDRGFDRGDFSTPERSVPDGSRFPHMTEACESVGEQGWGYRKNEDYFSARYLMSSLDKIMAMGGSYLLNVGPDADGVFPPEAQRLLHTVGDFHLRAKESLTETEEDPQKYGIRGGYPYVAVKKGDTVYLHFYRGIPSTCITFTEYPGDILSAFCVNSGRALPVVYDILPTLADPDGPARKKYVSVREIPTDDYPAEPIILGLRMKRTR